MSLLRTARILACASLFLSASAAAAPPALPPVDGLALGLDSSCALRGGLVSCIGGTSSKISFKGLVSGISAGAWHLCALTSAGEVRCTGHSSNGELGGSSSTASVPGLDRIAAVAAGEFHSCALGKDHKVYCWGAPFPVVLGEKPNSSTPAPLPGFKGVEELRVGTLFACGRFAGGVLQCLGWNGAGQLGDGTTKGKSAATKVKGLKNVKSFDLGTDFACAALKDGSVSCWGTNEHGELGLSKGSPGSSKPVKVKGLKDVVEVRLGCMNACARTAAGELFCWGENGWGELGDGSRVSRTGPVAVKEVAGATRLEVGCHHACAVDGTGALLCWGRNGAKQILDKAEEAFPTPVRVPAP